MDGGDEDMDMDDEEGLSERGDKGEADLLHIESVQVCNSDSDVDLSKMYDADVENLDGELHGMLLDTLHERGIDETFVNDLISVSTAVENQHYINFLKALQGFANER